MTKADIEILINEIESLRIKMGAEFEKACNEHDLTSALVFQTIRDDLANNKRVLHSYLWIKQLVQVCEGGSK